MKGKKRSRLKAVCVLLTLVLVSLVAWLLMPEKPPEPTLTAPPQPNHKEQTEPTETEVPSQTEPEALTGWQEQDGRRYYLREDGTVATGWLDVAENRYYLDASGVMQTGWLELEGNAYYLHPDGVLAVGQVQIDGRNRFFTSAGVETVMANPWNFIPEDYETDLVLLESDIALEDMKVQRICYDALRTMILDCNAYMEETYGGTDMFASAYVVSAYRTQEHQTRLYTNKVDKLMSQGYSREEAEKNAAMVNAYPGTSEHQLGLAVDIIDTHKWSLVEAQADLPAQKWLMANSWRYGFILRYPKDKTDVTGIIFEPWHYRYVGLELAKELYDCGLTMEEYFDTLYRPGYGVVE